MANEIVKLGRVLRPSGESADYQFLYLFPIVPPILVDNQIIAPTPSEHLPQTVDGRSAAELLTPDEIVKLDGGLLLAVSDGFPCGSEADVEPMAQKRYAARDPKLVDEERDKYDESHTGGRINAAPQGGP